MPHVAGQLHAAHPVVLTAMPIDERPCIVGRAIVHIEYAAMLVHEMVLLQERQLLQQSRRGDGEHFLLVEAGNHYV